jgi:UDP-N-acetylmuramoyl-tripeptide--D-alanyl-D-alanine ligase
VIALTLDDIAGITGGDVHGDGTVLVTAPTTIDSRVVTEGGLFAALAGEHVDGHDFAGQAMDAGAVAVLASREVDAPAVIVDDVTAALARLATEVLGRLDGLTVIGITGSHGKTGVKDMLAHVLEPEGETVAPPGSLNNELGVPLTVLRADERTRFLVLEMGARGPGHIATLCRIAPPDIGLVLNVGRAHLGEFGSPEGTAQAKGELVEAVGADGVAVLNADDPLVFGMASRTRGRVLTFGRQGEVALDDVSLDEIGRPRFTLTYEGRTVDAFVPQIGPHQAINAAAAAAGALAAGLHLDEIAASLATAGPRSPMRMAHHVRADGLVVVDDAYNANPESMTAALRAVAAMAQGRGVAVLGEMLELGPDSHDAHVEVGEVAAELGFRRVVVVGEGAAGIAEGAGDIAELVPDVDVAVRTLSASLSGDEVVLVKASRGGRLERVVHALLEG